MIGILADSHDNLTTLRRAVAEFRGRGCELILHAGDFIAPFAARELEKTGCPVRAVYGNCDGEKEGLRAVLDPVGGVWDEPYVFEFKGLKYVLTHRHEKIKALIAEHSPGILVYGHTHKPEIRTDGGTLVINPGEAGGWLSGRSTAAIFYPEKRRVEIFGLA